MKAFFLLSFVDSEQVFIVTLINDLVISEASQTFPLAVFSIIYVVVLFAKHCITRFWFL